jgi:DNA repair exonuclease SbcCD ATPase subunit
MENEHVRDLLDILRENNYSAHDLAGVIENVAAMEKQINAAVSELTAVRRQLETMQEERDHPIRTMLLKAARGLMQKLRAARSWIAALKEKIITGCKNAVDDFKQRGVSALNNLAGYFNVRAELDAARNGINEAMEYNRGAIARIEAAAEQYHAAGRSVRNIGRALRGRDTIPGIKPNGKLARLIEAPYQSELRRLARSLNRVNKAAAALDRLEKAAARQSEQDRPSTLANMRRLQAVVDQRKKDAPVRDSTRQADVAI